MKKPVQKPIENADFDKAVTDYVNCRVGFPDSLFNRLAEWQIGTGDQAILDLGTGTGTLARGFALRGNRVIATDIAPQMLDAARKIDAQHNVEIEYHVAAAEKIPLRSASLDIVSAGQCWHWFDRGAVAREVKRVLKPGGCLIIAHYDWIPLQGNIVRLTEKLIEKHNPEWRGGNWNGVYGQWLRDMGEAGFQNIESFTYDEAADYTSPAWRGRVRASAGIQASLEPDQVSVFDQELQALLEDRFPSANHRVPHRVFAACGRKAI
jgi:ubiquinone/menaquinone biosynthesis C-methylase UbiE